MAYKDEMRKLIDIVKQQSFTAPLEQTLDDRQTMANAVKDMSDRIDLKVRKSLQPTDKAKKTTSKKSKGIAKAKAFQSVKPPQPSASNTTSPTTPNSAIVSKSFTSKDISDIRNDYLQKQSELQPTKPQSPFNRFETNGVDKETIGNIEMWQNGIKKQHFKPFIVVFFDG